MTILDLTNFKLPKDFYNMCKNQEILVLGQVSDLDFDEKDLFRGTIKLLNQTVIISSRIDHNFLENDISSNDEQKIVHTENLSSFEKLLFSSLKLQSPIEINIEKNIIERIRVYADIEVPNTVDRLFSLASARLSCQGCINRLTKTYGSTKARRWCCANHVPCSNSSTCP